MDVAKTLDGKVMELVGHLILHRQSLIFLGKNGGTGGSGLVHLNGENSLAMSGLGCKKSLSRVVFPLILLIS